ncbi:hypothetical protein EDD11_009783 [Mortierella claussenii]|nr:hypothetical protein EDD11_009783 [Mortierella claussenii]
MDSPSNPLEWDATRVCRWLKETFHFPQETLAQFLENDVDGSVLLEDLDHEALKTEFGFSSFGQRVKILKRIWALRGEVMLDNLPQGQKHGQELGSHNHTVFSASTVSDGPLETSPITGTSSLILPTNPADHTSAAMDLKGLGLTLPPHSPQFISAYQSPAVPARRWSEPKRARDEEFDQIPLLRKPLRVFREYSAELHKSQCPTFQLPPQSHEDDCLVDFDGISLGEGENTDADEEEDENEDIGQEGGGYDDIDNLSSKELSDKSKGLTPLSISPGTPQRTAAAPSVLPLDSSPDTSIANINRAPATHARLSSTRDTKRIMPQLVLTELQRRPVEATPYAPAFNKSSSMIPTPQDLEPVEQHKSYLNASSVSSSARSGNGQAMYFPSRGWSLPSIFFKNDGLPLDSDSDSGDSWIIKPSYTSRHATAEGQKILVQRHMKRVLREPPVFKSSGNIVYAPVRRKQKNVPVLVISPGKGNKAEVRPSTWDVTFKDESAKTSLRVDLNPNDIDLTSINFRKLTGGKDPVMSAVALAGNIDKVLPLYGDSDASEYTTDEELLREVAREEREGVKALEKRGRAPAARKSMSPTEIRQLVDDYKAAYEEQWRSDKTPGLEKSRFRIYQELLQRHFDAAGAVEWIKKRVHQLAAERLPSIIDAFLDTPYRSAEEVRRACKAMDWTLDELLAFQWRLSLVQGPAPISGSPLEPELVSEARTQVQHEVVEILSGSNSSSRSPSLSSIKVAGTSAKSSMISKANEREYFTVDEDDEDMTEERRQRELDDLFIDDSELCEGEEQRESWSQSEVEEVEMKEKSQRLKRLKPKKKKSRVSEEHRIARIQRRRERKKDKKEQKLLKQFRLSLETSKSGVETSTTLQSGEAASEGSSVRLTHSRDEPLMRNDSPTSHSPTDVGLLLMGTEQTANELQRHRDISLNNSSDESRPSKRRDHKHDDADLAGTAAEQALTAVWSEPQKDASSNANKDTDTRVSSVPFEDKVKADHHTSGPPGNYLAMRRPDWRDELKNDEVIAKELRNMRRNMCVGKNIRYHEPYLSAFQEYTEWVELDGGATIDISDFLKWKDEGNNTKEYREKVKEAAKLQAAQTLLEKKEWKERERKHKEQRERERKGRERKEKEERKKIELEGIALRNIALDQLDAKSSAAMKTIAAMRGNGRSVSKCSKDETDIDGKQGKFMADKSHTDIITIRSDTSDDDERSQRQPLQPHSRRNVAKLQTVMHSDEGSYDARDGELPSEVQEFNFKKRARVIRNRFGDSSDDGSDSCSPSSSSSLEEDRPPTKRRIARPMREEAAEVITLRRDAQKNEEELRKRIKDQEMREQLRGNRGDLGEGDILMNPGHKKTERPVVIPAFLAENLKPHQIDGVRFMWKNVVMFDGGCILAHAMGLGKTFQVVAFVYVLLKEIRDGNKDIPKKLQVLRVVDMKCFIGCFWRRFFKLIHNGPYSDDYKEGRVLLLMPPIVLENWSTEFQKWIPEHLRDVFNVYSLSLTKGHDSRIATLEDWHTAGGVLLLGYHKFRDMCNKSKDLSVDLVERYRELVLKGTSLTIADEGHALKNPSAKLSTAVGGLQSTARIVLTGYPLQNRLEEYWCMVDFIRPNFLGDINTFRHNYIRPISHGLYSDCTAVEKKVSTKKMQVLTELIKNFVMRLSTLQYFLYTSFLETLPSDKSYVSVIGNSHLLLTMCNHPAIFKATLIKNRKREEAASAKTAANLKDQSSSSAVADSPLTGSKDSAMMDDNEEAEDVTDISNSFKVKILMDIITECRALNEKVLVFTRSIPTIDFLEHVTMQNGFRTMKLDGDTRIQDRQDMINDFNNSSDYDIFLISSGAGSQGVNLVSASRVVIFDVGWNPSHDEQAIARAFRYGQTRKVFVYRLQTYGTFEDKLHKMNLYKLGLSKGVVDKKNTIKSHTRMEMHQYFEAPPSHSPTWATEENIEELFAKPDTEDPVLRKVIDQNAEFLTRIVPQSELVREEDSDLTPADLLEIANMIEQEEQRIKGMSGQTGTPIPPITPQHVVRQAAHAPSRPLPVYATVSSLPPVSILEPFSLPNVDLLLSTTNAMTGRSLYEQLTPKQKLQLQKTQGPQREQLALQVWQDYERQRLLLQSQRPQPEVFGGLQLMQPPGLVSSPRMEAGAEESPSGVSGTQGINKIQMPISMPSGPTASVGTLGPTRFMASNVGTEDRGMQSSSSLIEDYAAWQNGRPSTISMRESQVLKEPLPSPFEDGTLSDLGSIQASNGRDASNQESDLMGEATYQSVLQQHFGRNSSII